jgi:5-formyltetrahydrofolate cyclo-ligase
MSLSKAALREQMRAEAVRHSEDARIEGSRAICERIEEQDVWRRARKVLLFMPMEGEPDVAPLVQSALTSGKTVALPRFDAESQQYGAAIIANPSQQVAPGKFGVREPLAECPSVPLKELDFALVPGIGFSLNGCRLGRGRGFFDRILCQVRGWKCGVAFDWQLTVCIPSEEHDIHVDSIVTPTRWHLVRS